MSLLDTGIQSIFAKAFAGIYLPATLYKRDLIDDGEGGYTTAETQHSCRAQVDACGEKMRASAGYTDTDVAIYILQGSTNAEPCSDDEIVTNKGRYALANSDTDPGSAYWLFRGTRA